MKSLQVLRYPSIYNLISKYVDSAKQKGVYIGELLINPYVYASKSFDVSFLVNYIESLNNVAGVFRDIYDEYLYALVLQKSIDNSVYGIDMFHYIFNDINNTFNEYLNDRYSFEDFSIYHSETSLDTIMAMFETFNNSFKWYMSSITDTNLVSEVIGNKSIKMIPYVYDKIFEQFEYIYLPFY